LPQLKDGFAVTQREELHLLDAGITSVIWAAGYRFDFGMVKLPVLDSDGYPVQKRGVTAYPGLYFVGLPWLHNQKSGLLSGMGDDAAHIAAHLAARHDREGAPAAGGQVDVQDDIMAL
jgi:putative flavoprotein involved in K+ transport